MSDVIVSVSRINITVRLKVEDGFARAVAMADGSATEFKPLITEACMSRDPDRAVAYALSELAVMMERGAR